MKSHNLLIAAAVLWVCGCGGSDEVAPSHGTPEELKEKEPSAVARGTIAQNESVMDIKDAYCPVKPECWGWADWHVLSFCVDLSPNQGGFPCRRSTWCDSLIKSVKHVPR
jgi:hypothetical protein